jgi:hypothetical protein
VITNQVTLGYLLAKQINVLPTIANPLPYGGTTKMPVYTISINQRSKSGIDHQNNQPTFLNRENSFHFRLRFPIT